MNITFSQPPYIKPVIKKAPANKEVSFKGGSLGQKDFFDVYCQYGMPPEVAIAASLAALAVVVGAGFVSNAVNEQVKKQQYNKLMKIDHMYKSDISDIQVKNPHIKKKEIQKRFNTELENASIKPNPGGSEKGINNLVGISEVKYQLLSKLFVPVCSNKTHSIPNGVNITGAKGAELEYVADSILDHHLEKGGSIVKFDFSNDDTADIQKLNSIFKKANETFQESGKYTMLYLPDADKNVCSEDNLHSKRAARILELTNNCKDNGVIILTTSNNNDKVDKGLKREGRTDLVIEIPKVKSASLIDMVKFSDKYNRALKKENLKNIAGQLNDSEVLYKPTSVINIVCSGDSDSEIANKINSI